VETSEVVRAINSVAPVCSQCEWEHRIGRRRYLCRACLVAVEMRDRIVQTVISEGGAL
jgi:hypothetical protein